MTVSDENGRLTYPGVVYGSVYFYYLTVEKTDELRSCDLGVIRLRATISA